MSRTPNPVSEAYGGNAPGSLSSVTYHIAGVLTTVYGLDELSEYQPKDVACLWLLHPRLQTSEYMQPFVAPAIHDWNARIRDGRTKSRKGLIAASFDQRNHGTRQVHGIANEAWKNGNPSHAQDMFCCYRELLLFPDLTITYYATERLVTLHSSVT